MAIDADVLREAHVFRNRFKFLKGREYTREELSSMTAVDLANSRVYVDGRLVLVRAARNLRFDEGGIIREPYDSPYIVFGLNKVGPASDNIPVDKVPALDYLKKIAEHSDIFIF